MGHRVAATSDRSGRPTTRQRHRSAARDRLQESIELQPSVAAFGTADAFIGKFHGDNPS
jgi:hypothetical protein